MASCGNSKVCDCEVCAARDAEMYATGDWVDEPWSSWLPAMIRADYWQYYEPSDLNSAVLPNGCSDHARLEFHTTYSKRYFCTSCPQRGPLLPHEILADHALHETIGVSRLWNFTGVLHDELKGFLDVSDIKQKYGSDGKSYLPLRSLVRPDRRAKSPDEITCFDCELIKTMGRRNILTTFCSVECQFSSRLSRDAAFLFRLMVPEETRVRKFHHYMDYNFVRYSIDSPVQKKRSKITTSKDVDENHNTPSGRLPSNTRNGVQYTEGLLPIVAAIRGMQIS